MRVEIYENSKSRDVEMKDLGLNTNEDMSSLWCKVLRKFKRVWMLTIPFDVVRKRKIAVVLASYNRSGMRLENALLTLRNQTLPSSQVDITICDWGSDAENVSRLREMCARHRVRLILVPPTLQSFNKSKAVNIAIRHTPNDAEFVLQTDVDMIFQSNYIEMIIRAGIQFYPSLVLCSALEIQQGNAQVAEKMNPMKDYSAIRALSRLRGGVGMCICAPRQWFFHIQGYDERYTLWGHEDDDILKRAKLDGLHQVGIADRTSLIHQWHVPATANLELLTEDERRRRQEALIANKTLYLNSMSVIRNLEGWGMDPEGTKVVEPLLGEGKKD